MQDIETVLALAREVLEGKTRSYVVAAKQLAEFVTEQHAAKTMEAPKSPPPPIVFRVGRKVAMTVYRDDVFIGSCTEPRFASELVEYANKGYAQEK